MHEAFPFDPVAGRVYRVDPARPRRRRSKQAAPKAALKVDFQKFTLPNGLEVIFHIDRSDPVVAVNLTAHVGSSREKAGRTGFAHLFEHLLFLESENLGKGGLDKMTARIGGSGANGSTSQDRTNYLQTVPKDALEKMIWAEADKLGWFINTVTDPVLAKEKQVVKNEKRQGVDNAPYGHTRYVINKALYPADHPYNWQVIGSLEDLQNAQLDDVKEFFRLWYVPNNVTLVLAGDFDPVQARKWVEKYFSEIKRGEPIKAMAKRPGVVKQTVKLAHEDNFAKLPELTMAWPTVEDLHPDSYALEVLAEYLSQTKRAPFYKVLVEDSKLAPNVQIGNQTAELAGQFMLRIRAFEGKPLDEVAAAVDKAFAKFEAEGIPEKDLNRIKAGLETRFYNSVSSVLGKSALLAEYNYLNGNPGYVSEGVRKTLAVIGGRRAARVRHLYQGQAVCGDQFCPERQAGAGLERIEQGRSRRRKSGAGRGECGRHERERGLYQDPVRVRPQQGARLRRHAGSQGAAGVGHDAGQRHARGRHREPRSAAGAVRYRDRWRPAARPARQGRRGQPDGAHDDPGYRHENPARAGRSDPATGRDDQRSGAYRGRAHQRDHPGAQL